MKKKLSVIGWILVLAALILFIWQPEYTPKAQKEILMVLTEGFEDDFREQKDSFYVFYTKNALSESLKKYNFERFNYFDEILQKKQGFLEIIIKGNGLDEGDTTWQNISQNTLSRIKYLPQKSQNGIFEIDFPQSLDVSQEGIVKGNFRMREPKKQYIYLLNMGIRRDSFLLQKVENQKFTFKIKPTQAGNYLYELQAQAQTWRVPVWVQDAPKTQVLFLENQPTFENKFLKNWLFESENEVFIRSQTSQTKYRYEQLNTNEPNFPSITEENLEKYNLLVLDAETLLLLGANEKNAIQNAVLKGLGIALRAEPKDLKKDAFFLDFETKVAQNAQKKDFDFPNLALSSGNPLFLDESKNVFCASLRRGAGKITLNLIQNTFQWKLEGKKEFYSNFWANIISQTTQKTTQKPEIYFQKSLFFKNEPIIFKISGETSENTFIVDNQKVMDTVFCQNPPHNPTALQGCFWANTTGWHQIKTLKGEQIGSFYVSKTDDWKALRAEKSKRATQLLLERYNGSKFLDKKNEKESKKNTIKISFIWYFCLLVTGFGFWWTKEIL